MKNKYEIMRQRIGKIERWLNKGHSQTELAAALGYETSGSISLWLRRGRVPPHMWLRVAEIISNKRRDNGDN